MKHSFLFSRRSVGALVYLIVLSLGYCAGIWAQPAVLQTAQMLSNGFVLLLKWLSIPLIALSILSTTQQLSDKHELLRLGTLVGRYTLLTTLLAGGLALVLFRFIQPVQGEAWPASSTAPVLSYAAGGFGLLLLGTVLGALLLGFAGLAWHPPGYALIQQVTTRTYNILLRLVQGLGRLMPVVIWAFVTIFVQTIQTQPLLWKVLSRYLACIILANVLQAAMVLPMLLRMHGIPVLWALRGVFSALMTAFWAKSSSVALPFTLNSVRKNLKVSAKTANFTLPLCTTVNMNACAAFILVTVLFVSGMQGRIFTLPTQVMFIAVATLAAIGNAGVPMGCYTLSGAILSFLGLDLKLLGIILPCYALIDMLESAINVWSDVCVTLLVNNKLEHE